MGKIILYALMDNVRNNNNKNWLNLLTSVQYMFNRIISAMIKKKKEEQ